VAEALTLVLNVGSSSLKAAVFATAADGGERLWQGQIGLQAADPARDHHALRQWLEPTLEPWWPRIGRVGHRLVHGGERFTAPTRIEATVLEALTALNPLAPLHNPPALAAIHWLRQQRPSLEQWACFDTAFHATLTPAAYSYALPADWRQGGCRRYGFHGLSHQHLAEAATRHWQALGHRGQPRLISCHLGAGCSLAAIAAGCSVDTSMGFTPLEGLVMASRSGSVDPGLLLHLQRRGIGLEALEQGLNRDSGLRGLSGLSGDWLELQAAAHAGHAGAQLALAVFRHRLLAGIGAMAASLGGVEMIGLTGGIGAADAALLADLQAALGWLGPVEWLQLSSDEEGMIARLLPAGGALSDPADPGSGAAGGSAAGDRH
jgi:acetate kinase